MKIKNKVIISAILVIAILCTLFYIYGSKFMITSKSDKFTVVNFNQEHSSNGESVTFENFLGVRTVKEVTVNKGDKINIKYNSKITGDQFKIIVLDPDYKVIEELEGNVEKSQEVKAEKSGNYLIRIFGKDVSGNLEIEFISKDKASGA